MNAKPGKNGGGHTLGLFLTEQQIAYSVMKSGGKEAASGIEQRGSESAEEIFERIVKPWMGTAARSKLRVVLGVPEIHTFHNARTQAPDARDTATADDWLQNALQTQNARSDPMIVDQSKTLIAKQIVAGLVACRRKCVTETIEPFVGNGGRFLRAEPAPFGLFREGCRVAPAPKNSRVSARLFVGSSQAMLVMAIGKRPVGWRSIPVPTSDPAAMMDSTISTIRMMARQWQLETGVDTLIIHGRPEIDLQSKIAQLSTKFGIKILRVAEPAYEIATIVRGLARGGKCDEGDIDLAREFRPKEAIVDIFPWGQTAIQLLLFGAVTFFLIDAGNSLKADRVATNMEMDKLKWLKNRQEADLSKEETQLITKRQAVEKFLKSRVEWSNQIHDVVSQLPPNTSLVSVIGVGELERTAKKDASAPKAKKSFIVRLATPIPESGVMPADIDGFMSSLRADSAVKKEFPLIELADLKNMRDSKTLMALANYSVVCMPAEPKPKAGASAEAEK